MFYRGYTETKAISGALTLTSANQTVSLRIPTNRRRLEKITLEVGFTIPATAPTYYSDGNLALVKEVRFKVNDVIGQRSLIQASGPQLVQWQYDQGGRISRHNLLSAFNATNAATIQKIFIPIWLRHPAIEEPIGNILSLPMYALNEDPVLEIDLANDQSASANPVTAVTYVRAILHYRDVDVRVKYLPSELVNSNWVVAATGNQSFDLANSGFITSLALDEYTTAYTARGLMYATTDYSHEWQVSLGPIALRRYFPSALQNAVDDVVGVPTAEYATAASRFYAFLGVAAGALTGPGLTHYNIDFLFDDMPSMAFSPASTINANTLQQGGDKVKLTGTNFNATGTVKILTHKFVTRTQEDLAALIGG